MGAVDLDVFMEFVGKFAGTIPPAAEVNRGKLPTESLKRQAYASRAASEPGWRISARA